MRWVAALRLCFRHSGESSPSSTNGPVTRAEVRADLECFLQAGYRPVATDHAYPDDIQRAAAIVAQGQAKPGASAVGGVTMSGSSDAGSRATASADGRSIYAGH